MGKLASYGILHAMNTNQGATSLLHWYKFTNLFVGCKFIFSVCMRTNQSCFGRLSLHHPGSSSSSLLTFNPDGALFGTRISAAQLSSNLRDVEEVQVIVSSSYVKDESNRHKFDCKAFMSQNLCPHTYVLSSR
jgi:hypothetical protein